MLKSLKRGVIYTKKKKNWLIGRKFYMYLFHVLLLLGKYSIFTTLQIIFSFYNFEFTDWARFYVKICTWWHIGKEVHPKGNKQREEIEAGKVAKSAYSKVESMWDF